MVTRWNLEEDLAPFLPSSCFLWKDYQSLDYPPLSSWTHAHTHARAPAHTRHSSACRHSSPVDVVLSGLKLDILFFLSLNIAVFVTMHPKAQTLNSQFIIFVSFYLKHLLFVLIPYLIQKTRNYVSIVEKHNSSYVFYENLPLSINIH